MTVTLITPGRKIEVDGQADAQLVELGLRVKARAAVQVTPASRGVGDMARIENAADDDVIELEYRGGAREWTTVGRLRRRLPPATRAAGKPDELLIAPELAAGSTRGIADMVLAALKLLKIDPLGKLAGLAAREAVAHYESKMDPAPGVYRVKADGSFLGASPLKPKALKDAGRPYLVFLHGTFSSTRGSFGKLFTTPEWRQLVDFYDDRHILGLEHRTLSESPAQNALQLARCLPKGARLHLVSHSRGGLVGELLCRGPIADLERDLLPFRLAKNWSAEDRQAVTEQLTALSALLRDQDMRVERFARVACPGRGTLIVSERMDRYLSILLNLLGHIPSFEASVTYAIAKASILSLIQQRAEPGVLPGLEAIMPSSPYIRFLNMPGVRTDADLGAIAGDVQGEGAGVGVGVLDQLKVLAADLFFREDHDLVVNTDSMYGGVERSMTGGEAPSPRAYASFHQGPQVDHFSYFSNASSRRQIVAWLTRAGDKPPAGFKPIERGKLREITPISARGGSADAPVVFLIPDAMATFLRRDGRRVWPDAASLAQGHLGDLAFEAGDAIRADTLLGDSYLKLLAYLSNHFDVLPFPYDWRKSVIDEGRRLAGAVETELRKHERPVHLLAHGMGGLVARAIRVAKRGAWEQLRKRGGRLVMLGTPNGGSYATLQLLVGQGNLAQSLALIDPARDAGDIAAIFRTCPGLLEMLPAAAKVWTMDWWKSLQPPLAADERTGLARRLTEAKKTRDSLNQAGIDRDHMVCVAGSGLPTPSDVSIAPEDGGRPVFTMAGDGDGRVSQALTRLKDVPIFYMGAAHGDLVNRYADFPALAELLKTGNTDKLSSTAPAAPATRGVAAGARGDEPALYPTAEDLVAAISGSAEAPSPSREVISMRVSVCNASLEFARCPLAIGHYEGDLLVGAERFLDKQLGGRLSARFGMRQYPGPAGTFETILDEERRPPGVLVIGLGQVGELTPEKLTRNVADAALRLAIARVDQPSSKAGWRSAGFSALLIGTKGGRGLSIEASVAAIVKGALQANHALRERGLLDQVRVDEVEFIEMYEDIATRAAHAVAGLEPQLGLLALDDCQVELARIMRRSDGWSPGLPLYEYSDGWWRRIQITRSDDRGDAESQAAGEADDAGGLQFTMLTDRARAEIALRATQRRLIDEFIKRAIHTHQPTGDLMATLYELLLPNPLKQQTQQQPADLQLVLDGYAAQYPWEMLSERDREGKITPLAIQVAMLRQLSVAEYRPHVQSPRGNNALVIGAPKLDPQRYAPLPQAAAEAEDVARVLDENGYDIGGGAVIGEDAESILNRLFAREYRILHVAGHGSYDPLHPARSGVLIGDGAFLTAAEIEQLRSVPDLVFLNCCHLAKTDEPGNARPEFADDRHAWNKLAASISEQLIKIGVRAVVAAGWAVNDGAAKVFANVLYQQMLAGQPFGQAVHEARKQTYQGFEYTNTWGAYQCYGEPGFTLETSEGAGYTRAVTPFHPVAQHEVIRELRDIASRAAEQGPGKAESLLKEVDALLRTLPGEWRNSEVWVTAGNTYGELGACEKAIQYYRRALERKGDPAHVTLRAIEQLANMQVRRAEELRQKAQALSGSGKAGKQKAAKLDAERKVLLDEAKSWLDWLLAAGRTPERLALLGSNYKRMALAERGDVKAKQELAQAAGYYRQAHRLSQTKTSVDPYHALNWITCRYLTGGITSEQQQQYLNLIARCKESAQKAEAAEAGFWNRINVPDAELAQALLEGKLEDRFERIKRDYRDVLSGRVTARERRSALGNIKFLGELLARRGDAAAELLARLHQELV